MSFTIKHKHANQKNYIVSYMDPFSRSRKSAEKRVRVSAASEKEAENRILARAGQEGYPEELMIINVVIDDQLNPLH
jgi:hypothetical protein